MKKVLFSFTAILLVFHVTKGQHHHVSDAEALPLIEKVEPQPFLAQAIRLDEALTFLGSSLSKEDAGHLHMLKDKALTLRLPCTSNRYWIPIVCLWLTLILKQEVK